MLSLEPDKMSVRVFADMLSQPARAVAIFCSAANIPHELVRVRLGKGEARSQEFAKINPWLDEGSCHHRLNFPHRVCFESFLKTHYPSRLTLYAT